MSHRRLLGRRRHVAAFATLFEGLRALIANWRLTLVQVLPAVWVWLAMYDLRAKVTGTVRAIRMSLSLRAEPRAACQAASPS